MHHKNNVATRYVLFMAWGLVVRHLYREYGGIMQRAVSPCIVTMTVTGFAYEKIYFRASCITQPTNQTTNQCD